MLIFVNQLPSTASLPSLRHLSIVAQEFCLNVDKGFVNSMYRTLQPLVQQQQQQQIQHHVQQQAIHAELKKLNTPIIYSALQVRTA